MTQIAWFGGTFDPPHLGHIIMARQLVSRCKIDCLFFMPAKQNHKKRSRVSVHHRVAMLERIIAENGHYPFSLDTRETKRRGITYTIDSLKEIADQYPNVQRNFILGADAYTQLSTWKDYTHLCHYARLIVLQRNHDGKHISRQQSLWQQNNSDKITFVPVQPIACSSTEIRRLLRAGKNAQSMLSEAVRQYIDQESLYQHD